MNQKLRANTINRLTAHGIIVGESGAKRRPHYVLGESINDDELYLLANFMDNFRAMPDEMISEIVGRPVVSVKPSPQERLEALRVELREERISYGELCELESLAQYIDPSDTELLQALDPEGGYFAHLVADTSQYDPGGDTMDPGVLADEFYGIPPF